MERAVIDKRDRCSTCTQMVAIWCLWTLRPTNRSKSAGSNCDAPNYLVEGNAAVLQMYGSEIVGTELPASVVLEVKETEPGSPRGPSFGSA